MKSKFEFEDLDYNFVIGIDLGTTNSAVAYVDLTQNNEKGRKKIRFFEVQQVVGTNAINRRSILPSFLYLPGKYDLPEGSYELPWDKNREYIVGEFAREQGAKVPGRLVASAKSWLCHAGVDRKSPILPWGNNQDTPKVSPVDAAMRYLQHIREAWNFQMSQNDESREFEQQLIVLTVPASFDEVARELTVSAAQEAGIPKLVLIEEPLAAFYAWLSENEDTWQSQMSDGQIVLVCDVGGGTTDFSIVGIKSGEKGLRFNRLAVGEHLMLGGDNMDIALGRYLEQIITGKVGKLDARRWHQLVYQCRKAKETLMGASQQIKEMDIAVVGQSGSLIAGTLKGKLSQDEIQNLLIDGFFPKVSRSESPSNRTGLTEFGLPYVSDPAITKHLAAFWNRFENLMKQETGREHVFPDYILFNGGALTPKALRKHLTSIIQNWFVENAGTDWQPKELPNPRPELAVAVGAGYYGRVRLGEGVRIGSGSPRSYYVQINSGEQKQSLCLVPRGTEEGFETQIDKNFQALTNQAVSFQMVSSSTRVGDKLAEVVHLDEDEITPLPQIQTVLRYGKKGDAKSIPVQLVVKLTAIGTLELYCQASESEHRWQLQFDVRQDASGSSIEKEISETVDIAKIEKAVSIIQQTFTSGNEFSPKNVVKSIEAVFDLRKDEWSTTIIRKLADALLETIDGRKISAAHESRWLNLLGYCMRPGFGDPLDEWRMKKIWQLHFQKLAFTNAPQNRVEWWTFWRRVSGGLTPGKQLQIFQEIAPAIDNSKKKKSNIKLTPHETTEVWMALANFERLPVAEKTKLGKALVWKVNSNKPNPRELWAISRFGGRVPFYGPLNKIISSTDAAAWIDRLLKQNWEPKEVVANTLVQLGRQTGDRSRDIPTDLREQIESFLAPLSKGKSQINKLNAVHQQSSIEEQSDFFGEKLPSGLQLVVDDDD